MNHTFVNALRTVLVAAMMLTTGGTAMADGETPTTSTGVKVHGNVYGGGNNAAVKGNTKVDMQTGTVEKNLYGGGNLGDVGTHEQIEGDNPGNYNWKDIDGNANTPANANNKNTGVCTVEISGGTIGTDGSDNGDVFGGGKGVETTISFWCLKGMVYSTNVSVSNGTVKGNVYGGGEVGRVESNTVVTIGPDSGDDEPEINGSVFGAGKGLDTHGYSALVRGNPVVTIQGKAKVTGTLDNSSNLVEGTGNVYGGGEIASVGKHKVKTSNSPVTPSDAPADLPVGMPYTLANTNLGICTVNVIGSPTIAGNVYGAGKGIEPADYSTAKRMGMSDWETFASNDAYLVYVHTLALATDTHVTIGGTWNESTGVTASGEPTISGSVYGGSENGFVQFDTNVTISGGGVGNHVYGGGRGLATFADAGQVSGNANVTVNGGIVTHDVYGGGELGVVKESVEVNIAGGTVSRDVYGGGALANTNTANWNGSALVATAPYHVVSDLKAGTSVVTGLYTRSGSAEPYTYTEITTADSKAADGTTYYRLADTKVNLTGGTIGGDAYGGGLGRQAVTGSAEVAEVLYTAEDEEVIAGTKQVGDVKIPAQPAVAAVSAVEAMVYSNVTVNLNDNSGTCQVDGSVFGCNNANGTPKGNVTVNIYGTYVHNDDGTQKAKPTKFTDYTNVLDDDNNDQTDDLAHHTFELAGVYGGGNLASYSPVTGKSTTVNIRGCETSSIKEVYGGGNSADVSTCAVNVYGAYEIGYVYNGGNGWLIGIDGATSDAPANVNGDATTIIRGGTIYRTFGGSNTNGRIDGTATLDIADGTGTGACDLYLGDVFGYGNRATMNNPANVILGCLDKKVGALYGGAMNADINSDVTLTINSGTFANVFGGNKSSGTISGSIKVIIEQTDPDCPIIIDNLYGCGNDAAYTTPDGEDQPEVRIISCTSIGNVFGGGYGSNATVTGNPTVNINMVKSTDQENLGTVGNVYGGGYGANVTGNTIVNIGTAATITMTSERDSEGNLLATQSTKNVEGANITGSVYGGGYAANVDGNTEVNIGTVDLAQGATGITIGTDVYGGGEGSTTNVTGSVEVNVGNQITSGNTTSFVGGATISHDVYGGSAFGKVNYKETVDGTTQVNLYKGTINGIVFGGGKGVASTPTVPATDTTPEVPADPGVVAEVYGATTVTLYGDVVAGGIYGGCNLNGTMKGNTQLDLLGGRVGVAPASGASTPDIVFGGGLGPDTKVDGNVTVNVGDADNAGTTIYSNVYGGSAKGTVNSSTSNTTTVNLFKGIIYGDVFGGGLGDAQNPAAVKGKVVVKLNENNGTCFVSGSIYGCNNTNGSPEGDVEVHIYNTVHLDADGKVETTEPGTGVYEMTAVYGGGKKAAFTASGKTAKVYIETCDPSIQDVYGGGFGADVPNTYVEVKGAKEIRYVFGGGYGADTEGFTNPGANVNGTTNVLLEGGTVHEAYGGSNTKGDITGGSNVNVSDNGNTSCPLSVEHVYGGGKNASMSGSANIILGCQPNTWIEDIYAGSREADVDGNVGLTITSGKFKRVFGGNKTSGKLKGSITLNIEETGGCDTPIIIGELYAGGNEADYSIYGYYQDDNDNNKWKGRTKAQYDEWFATLSDTEKAKPENQIKADPQLNVRAFTSIGAIYGGGYSAKMYANPTVSINVVKGYHSDDDLEAGSTPALAEVTPATTLPYPAHASGAIGSIGYVYGGGNLADVYGSTTVNIGTESTVTFITKPEHLGNMGTGEQTLETEGVAYIQRSDGLYEAKAEGAYITGDVFGGGNKAAVTGNTQVNICAKEGDDPATTDVIEEYHSVAPGSAGVTIEGTPPPTGGFGRGVFGGGNQGNVNGDSYVYFGGGAVNQTIYGGGCVADVLGNTHVTMLDGYVFDGVCGGGLKGSVGTITEREALPSGHSPHTGCLGGKPKTFTENTGKCTVVVTGGQIGPVEVATIGMGTTAHPAPISEGWVWGAGRGAVVGPEEDPDTDFSTYVYETDVTIGGTAFIMEGVVGGGEFGRVRHNTLVKIQDQCQIGVGAGQTTSDGLKPLAYTQQQWTAAETAVRGANATAINDAAAAMPACSHFPYGRNDGTTESPNWVYDTYDPYADEYANNHNNEYLYPGGSTTKASDGKTWIGCVFAGGSGYFPYKTTGTDGKISYNWLPSAGWVEGSSEVQISGGHILTSVYGGNEVTSVAGTSKVVMTGGTIGVPRKKDELKTNPMIGNLYGAGKGDPRSQFNGLTNVGSAVVEISGGVIYGSVYGGSEDGHVQGDATVMVKKNADSSKPNPIIGTWGASYIDGNVFGGGMGVTTNLAAGLVKGNTNITISDGTILHNIYGGGAYGSVGTFELSTDENKTTYHVPYKGMPVNWITNTGKATISITGGTIGTTGQENGMVFGSSRGDVGAPDQIHDKLAWVYDTEVKIGTSGASTGPAIKGSIYGSGENGHTFNNAVVRVHGGTIGISSGVDITYTENGQSVTKGGAAYPYRGNVYGGGCGTDKYYSSGVADAGHTLNDGMGDKYNPLAGIVYGNATVYMDGGTVVRNVYGAGAMGSVGTADVATSGLTTINISDGIIGVDGTAGAGNVFGAARGSAEATSNEYALVRNYTTVNISGGTIYGSVYGGGELGCVGRYSISSDMRNFYWTDLPSASINPEDPDTYTYNNTGVCNVNITGSSATVKGNVFGGGKGKEDTFWCEKAIVYGTNVNISAGTVENNVYGGGEVGRVETNTIVKIGPDSGSDAPEIKGDVFGAGAGKETHGYSALVRGNTTVTVQGEAKVYENVYGGGEIAAVGKYYLVDEAYKAAHPESKLEVGMPYSLVDENLGVCNVTIKGSAKIGYNGTGHVFGGGKGKVPAYYLGTTESYASINDMPYRMMSYNPERYNNNDNNPLKGLWTYSDASQKYVWEYFNTREKYHTFLQTLALATRTVVSVEGSARVNGSVYGGSESGFVQHNSSVTIKGSSTIGVSGTAETDGNVFGGGLGLEIFAEAGRVSGNATVNVNGGTVWRNVYGGGSLGPLGDYYYRVDPNNGSKTYTWTTGGTSSVTIDELDGNTTVIKGNVFGAGKGSKAKYECEPAMVLQSSVTINDGTVNGTVYGGGEVGRVNDNTTVTIGISGNTTKEPEIKGNVFGAGAGVETHGYSALVRGNSAITIQGEAKVGNSVYGGGELASVGRFVVVNSLPKQPVSGGICTVAIKDNARIGTGSTGGDVYGACKGVEPDWTTAQTSGHGHVMDDEVLHPFTSETDYLNFLKTLALTSNTEVTIGGSSTVNGSVYGGGQRGVTLAGVKVDMTGGTVKKDVYGGGALADTNTENWDGTTLTKYHEETRLTRPSYQVKAVEVGESVEELFIKEGDGYQSASGTAVSGTTYYEKVPGSSLAGYYTKSGDEYTLLTSGTADENTTYYRFTDTKVNLIGGVIEQDAYGGGLGRKASSGVSAVEAMVYGDVKVELNNNNNGGTADGNKAGCAVNRVFGCNNLNGTPKGKVQVYVYATQKKGETKLSTKATKNTNTYDVQAVYGGGNLAKYEPVDALLDYNETNKATVDAARPEVYIDGCDLTSIKQVYGGGNAAPAPATYVEINRAYEIDEAFGGGNGYVDYSLQEGNNTVWYQNPGANVGYYTYATYPKGTGQGSGTEADPYKAVEIEKFSGKAEHKANRLSTTDPDAIKIRYGSGIATLIVKGGTVHTAYGGSNSKGNVRAKLASSFSAMFDDCPMDLGTSYGGGKNAYSDADAEVVADCAKGVKEMFGGAKNADFTGDVNMLITNGSSLERVFGANNTSGAFNGNITITLKEGGCEPIRIGSLYAGGFLAPYSVYGYKKDANGNYETVPAKDQNGNDILDEEGHQILEPIPLTSAPADAPENFKPQNDPRIIVISATRIDNIFGGGYLAKLVGNPHINVNMEPGRILEKYVVDTEANPFVGEHKDDQNKVIYVGKEIAENGDGILEIGTIGNIFGGGNMADIVGNTYVEIGNAKMRNEAGELVPSTSTGNAATITGNVYGGGNEADVTGNTYVNICANYDATEGKYVPVPEDASGVTISGNVFGGGKGKADSFECAKAMVGVKDDGDPGTSTTIPDGGTTVVIGNGTIEGTVYGGGEIGRVERNTIVKIGLGAGEAPGGTSTAASAPWIKGNVFGAGAGVETHGYSALVRGKTTVTIQGNAKVDSCVYGGGMIASVGRYNVKAGKNIPEGAPDWLPVGMPYSLKHPDTESGNCYVTIGGYAEIGLDNMQMPTFSGHVFGAGKGILPHEYDYTGDDKHYTGTKPQRRKNDDTMADIDTEPAYITFIETLGMTGRTYVNIEDHAFVKGSVYGGSENGHVLYDTHVTIDGDCQVGNGDGVNARYTDWTAASLKECAHWPYGKQTGTDTDGNPIMKYLPYDVYDLGTDNKPIAASDGHTFYGNVFGGGSGYFPYRHNPAWQKHAEKTAEVGQPVDENGYSDGIWLRSAGAVYGNTYVDIKKGHILTSVYGGNECTDVGKYPAGNITPDANTGTCYVNMIGGTIGVPRSEDDITAHPVTCCLYGAGKGDQRINFNTWTNVGSTQVKVSGEARIFGSVFGGGEDGHVIGDAETSIGGTVAIGGTNYSNSGVIIGTTGTSGCDGNVFGGGRGFSGDAQTAGTVGGDVRLTIEDGTILGNVYGGGRLASVGTLFSQPEDPNYGQFEEDNVTVYYTQAECDEYNTTYGLTSADTGFRTTSDVKKLGGPHGHITVNISGGTIGNDAVNAVSGNVYGGSMGRLNLLNGRINPIWPKMAQVKTATVNISQTEGKTTLVKRNVYGGGELGTVREDAAISITKGTINGSVYGGGYGSEDYGNPTTVKVYWNNVTAHYTYTPMQWAGCVGGNTTVSVAGGQVKQNVYGGGQMASVGIIDYSVKADGDGPFEYEGAKYSYNSVTKHADIVDEGQTTEKVYGFGLSWPYEFTYVPCKPNTTEVGGKTTVTVEGGRIGGYVYGAGKGKAFERYTEAFCANVRETQVNINYTETPSSTDGSTDCIVESVYGGGEDGHVYEDAAVNITGGLIGVSVYGGGKGEGKYEGKLRSRTSPYDWDDTPVQLPSWTAGKVYGNTTVTMGDGHVLVNVYGGGNMGSVGKGNYASGTDDYYPAGYGETLKDKDLWTKTDGFNPDAPITESNKPTTMADYFLSSGKCTVNIIGGTIGTSNGVYGTVGGIDQKTPTGMVFGGSRGRAAEDIGRLSPRYAFAPDFFLGYVNKTEVTIGVKDDDTYSPTIYSQVFGGGRDGHVRNSSHVIINNGIIGQAYDDYNTISDNTDRESQRRNCGNVYASGSGMGTWDGKHHGTSSGSITRNATVDINGGTIYGNVYGGGAMSSVGPPTIPPTAAVAAIDWSKCTVNINGGNIGVGTDYSTYGYGGCVFGASRGGDLTTDEFSEDNLDNYATTLWNEVNIKGGTIAGDVYGGGQAGRVKKDNTVNLTGGTVAHDVFGGGMGTSTIAANVGGNTTVTLNGTPTSGAGGTVSYLDNCVVNGSIFGANNVNGTPKGHVTVHVFKTANSAKDPSVLAANRTTYDVAAVFGGGKQADYVPDATDTKQSTEVIIEGCDLTSIQDVYGGGYGAATPGTNVLIKGTYIIDNVFGGGYGAGDDNPGANVGFTTEGTRNPYTDGEGKAVVQLMAGTIHHVYGGSNTKGDIRGGSNVTSVARGTGDISPNCCTDLNVQEIFGGGSQADMYGGTEIVLGCMPNDWVGAIYAGAESSNVGNDVSLTLTSGKFGRVFGGNKSGGSISGSIEVNIEENPDCGTPIIIGELYGGGDAAPYSVPDSYTQGNPNYQSPRVNVRAFTSIGNIFGGGYGSAAIVTGNPMVNINEVVLKKADGSDATNAYKVEDESEGALPSLIDGTTVKLYPHEAGKIGVIGNVFGGGNAAEVIGSTYVNIGTEAETPFVSLPMVPVLDANNQPVYETDQNGNPVYEIVNGQRVQETDANGTPLYESDGETPKWKRVQKKTPQTKPVVGADIQGNVYGGGNAAKVTGNTNVVIGQEKTTSTATNP